MGYKRHKTMFNSEIINLERMNVGPASIDDVRDIINDTDNKYLFAAAQQAGLDPDSLYTDGEGQILTAGEGSAVSDKANEIHYNLIREAVVEEIVKGFAGGAWTLDPEGNESSPMRMFVYSATGSEGYLAEQVERGIKQLDFEAVSSRLEGFMLGAFAEALNTDVDDLQNRDWWRVGDYIVCM